MPAILRIVANPGYYMERSIRPFLDSPPAARSSRLEPDQGTQPDQAVLEWSAQTNVEVTTVESLGFRVEQSADNWVEISRTTYTQRVTNPEDDSQYVDVEVIGNSVFRTERDSGRRQKLTFLTDAQAAAAAGG